MSESDIYDFLFNNLSLKCELDEFNNRLELRVAVILRHPASGEYRIIAEEKASAQLDAFTKLG